jgi:short subunit dehydrogenase-like uncharacterized protein
MDGAHLMPTSPRSLDVVLFGATGFTGRQTLAYFARHAPPGGVRWAIAGRDRAKLEAVRASVPGVPPAVEVLVADAQDLPALAAMASRTRVVLSTAGPFARHGGPLVDACVQSGTHYVDITGETPWVRDLIDRHHHRAAAGGTRIIPGCGFDSIPSDLGAYLIARHLRQQGLSCGPVKAYFRMAGGVNGGTLASAVALAQGGQAERLRDPFLLDPDSVHSPEEIALARDPVAPEHDPDLASWVGPFFMGPVNTRVVRRSAALFAGWEEPYGSGFRYQEYLEYGSGPLAPLKAAGVTAGMALFQRLLGSPLRDLLSPVLPRPGEGPSQRSMDGGWFRCQLLGVGSDGRRVRTVLRDSGDPGNRVTAKCVSESALALVLDTPSLPGGAGRGGVLTPATGLGDTLVKRLRAAGMTLENPAPFDPGR